MMEQTGPATQMGTVAMTRNQTRSPSRFLPLPNEATQPAPMRARSFLKYSSSAQQAAEMRDHVVQQPLVLPARQFRQQDQVGRTADGQELGQALEQTQDDCMQDCPPGSLSIIIRKALVMPDPGQRHAGACLFRHPVG